MSQEITKEFFNKFRFLTGLQKKFFRYLQWCFKHWDAVFPKHKTWADKIGTTRKSICHMLKKFLKLGWISWKSRGAWNTNLYTLSPGIIDLDLINGKQFRSDKVTVEVTPNVFNPLGKTSREATGRGYHPKAKASHEKFITIPDYIDDIPIELPYEIKVKLSMVPRAYYEDALESVKRRAACGKHIGDRGKYLAGAAILRAQESGVKLNWGGYYNTLKRYAQGLPI